MLNRSYEQFYVSLNITINIMLQTLNVIKLSELLSCKIIERILFVMISEQSSTAVMCNIYSKSKLGYFGSGHYFLMKLSGCVHTA